MDILDQEVSGRPRRPLLRRGSDPRPTRRALAETLAGLDPDEVVVLLGDDLPAAGERRAWSPSPKPGGFPVWGTQLTSRAAFPSAHP